MTPPLVPCPSCDRHVRADEAACPFCKCRLPEGLAARAVPAATQRMTRAAAFVFGATTLVSACGAEVIETSGTGGGGGASATSGSASTTDAATSGGGGATVDAGPEDDGGAAALYGDPAPEDAEPADDGGGEPIYGAAPPFGDAGSKL